MSYYEKATAEALRNLELQEQTAKLWKTTVDYEVENNFYSYKQAGPTDYQPNATTTTSKLDAVKKVAVIPKAIGAPAVAGPPVLVAPEVINNRLKPEDIEGLIPAPRINIPEPEEIVDNNPEDNIPAPDVLEVEPKLTNEQMINVLLKTKSQTDRSYWRISRNADASKLFIGTNEVSFTYVDGKLALKGTIKGAEKSVIMTPGLVYMLTGKSYRLTQDEYDRWMRFVKSKPRGSMANKISIIDKKKGKGVRIHKVQNNIHKTKFYEKQTKGQGLTVIASRADAMDLLKSHLGQIQAGNDNRNVFNDTVEIVNFMKKQKWLTKKQYSGLIKMLY